MGSHAGIKPNDVLDMTMEELQAFLDGFNNRLMDQHVQAINSGYWAGYYTNSGRKAKAPATHIKKLMQAGTKKKRKTAGDEGMEQQVARFEALERKRLNMPSK